MLNVQVTGDQELITRLNNMPAEIRRSLLRKVTSLAMQLERKVKGEKLSGQVLHVVSGNLRASIFNAVTQTDTSTIGKVASSGDVKYAAIHEFGGTINIPETEAKGKAMAFMMGGKQAFFKKVAAHTVTMPERSFMRSALADMKDDIVDGLTEAVREGARR